jgi:hypothetical protein
MAPRGTRMLTKTRGVLSLAPYLADTTSCTICVIVQDGIDLLTQGLAMKVVLVLPNVLAISLLNIVL